MRNTELNNKEAKMQYIFLSLAILFLIIYVILRIAEHKITQENKELKKDNETYKEILIFANKALEKYNDMEHISDILKEIKKYEFGDKYRAYFVKMLKDLLEQVQLYNISLAFWKEYFDLIEEQAKEQTNENDKCGGDDVEV